jgi:hypothetical protein
MSTAAAIVGRPIPLGQFLAPREPGASSDVQRVDSQAAELRGIYQASVAITDREALVTEIFQVLADQWREDTRFDSSLMHSIAHPAYRAIVQLGQDAVPVLLRQLQQQQPEPWFLALREITGIDPVTPAQRGNMRALADAWLHWGRSHGLI